MKNRDGLETNDNWKTPAYIYDPLNEVFKFDHDPCPLNYTVDGLDYDNMWGESNFINPPYNKETKPKFINRAHFEWINKNKVCVLLIPAATGTKQFHNLLLPEARCFSFKEWKENPKDSLFLTLSKIILFVEGRISFEGVNTFGEYTTTGKGKHDSMIVILK